MVVLACFSIHKSRFNSMRWRLRMTIKLSLNKWLSLIWSWSRTESLQLLQKDKRRTHSLLQREQKTRLKASQMTTTNLRSPSWKSSHSTVTTRKQTKTTCLRKTSNSWMDIVLLRKRRQRELVVLMNFHLLSSPFSQSWLVRIVRLRAANTLVWLRLHTFWASSLLRVTLRSHLPSLAQSGMTHWQQPPRKAH